MNLHSHVPSSWISFKIIDRQWNAMEASVSNAAHQRNDIDYNTPLDYHSVDQTCDVLGDMDYCIGIEHMQQLVL